MLKSRYLCGGSVMAVALALGGQAFAQQASTVEEVVVTGSFIRGTPEDAALPVDVIGPTTWLNRARRAPSSF